MPTISQERRIVDELCLTCVDFETTRDAEKRLHIIEIGAILLDDALQPYREFSSLVRPPCRVNPIDIGVTGLTDGDLASADPSSVVFPQFLDFIGDAIILAHNASFERNIALETCRYLGLPLPNWVFIDTLRLARKYMEAESYSLQNLLRDLGISYPKHRALWDCKGTAHLFKNIIEAMPEEIKSDAIHQAVRIGMVEESLRKVGGKKFEHGREESSQQELF